MTASVMTFPELIAILESFCEHLKEEFVCFKEKNIMMLQQLDGRREALMLKIAALADQVEKGAITIRCDESPEYRQQLSDMAEEIRRSLFAGREEIKEMQAVQAVVLELIKKILIDEKSRTSNYNEHGELVTHVKAKQGAPADDQDYFHIKSDI